MLTRQEENKYCNDIINKFINEQYNNILYLISRNISKIKDLEKYKTILDLSLALTGEKVWSSDIKFLLTYDQKFYKDINEIINVMLPKYLSKEFVSNYKSLTFLKVPLTDKIIDKLYKEKISEVVILYKLRGKA